MYDSGMALLNFKGPRENQLTYVQVESKLSHLFSYIAEPANTVEFQPDIILAC